LQALQAGHTRVTGMLELMLYVCLLVHVRRSLAEHHVRAGEWVDLSVISWVVGALGPVILQLHVCQIEPSKAGAEPP
jgi:hypothetical protein